MIEYKEGIKFNVYKVTNTTSGKVYIGCSSKTDEKYLGSGTEILKDVKALGREIFSKEILSYHTTVEEALIREKEVINEIFSSGVDTYNLRQGGAGGMLKSLGKRTVVNEYGQYFQIEKDYSGMDFGKIENINKNTIIVKDDSGNCFRVAKDHPDFLSGKLKSHLKGKIIVRDRKRGINYATSKNDIRIKTGEVCHVGEKTRFEKGKVSAKNINGEVEMVCKGDIRFLTGELEDLGEKTRYKKGDKWMYNPKDKKVLCVSEDDIDLYKTNGWIFGRGVSCKKWIHNPVTKETRRLPEEEAVEKVRGGWVFGRGLAKNR